MGAVAAIYEIAGGTLLAIGWGRQGIYGLFVLALPVKKIKITLWNEFWEILGVRDPKGQTEFTLFKPDQTFRLFYFQESKIWDQRFGQRMKKSL